MSVRRLAHIMLLLLLTTGGSAGTASADTTASTGITFTTQSAGSLAISFSELEDGYTFRNAFGETSLSVNALDGDTATASIRITWVDSREDAARTAFTISLRADDLVSTQNAPGRNEPFVISSGAIGIAQIGDIPVTPVLSLDSPRAVFTSTEAPVVGEQSLTIILQFDVPPSSAALTYLTKLQVIVAPGEGGP